MSELQIGDAGKTDSGFWPSYKIVAEHSDGRLICELMSASGVPHLCTVKDGKASGIKLLPPTPKVLTLRRWLCVGGFDGPKLLTTEVKFSLVDRPADIAYTPDGRIVSITFADEEQKPELLALQAGDVVRLRNGDEDRIERVDRDIGEAIGLRHVWGMDGRRVEWSADGKYVAQKESPADIVEIVKRAD